VALLRDADLPRARDLIETALQRLDGDAPPAARFEALQMRSSIGWFIGDLDDAERYAREALAVSAGGGLKDYESRAAELLAGIYLARVEVDEAEPFVSRALELADESGSLVARGRALHTKAELLELRGDDAAAEEAHRQARELFAEAGVAWQIGQQTAREAWLVWTRGDLRGAERLFRESIRVLTPLEDRAALCESQRGLAQLLVALGRLDEAERYALAALDTVGRHDNMSRGTTRMALGIVYAAQGRDAEAEALLREALAIIEATDFVRFQQTPLRELARFLQERGRGDEAAVYEARLAELRDAVNAARIA
jgi:tetratricopeptide (TPR) repeat protein